MTLHTPFILFEAGFALNRIIVDACRRRGFEPNVCRARWRGLGVAFLTKTIAEPGPRSHLSRLTTLERRNLAMAWRPGAYLSPAAGAWLGLMREAHSGPEMQASE